MVTYSIFTALLVVQYNYILPNNPILYTILYNYPFYLHIYHITFFLI